MAPTGRKGVGRPRRRTMKDPDMGAHDKEETKDLSGSEQDGKEGKTPVTDKNGRKRPSAGPVEEEAGAEVQNMLETVGVSKQNLTMAPTGRKGVGRPRRRTVKDPDMGADDKEEIKDLSGSEQDGKEGKTPVTDKNGRKRPSAAPVEEEVGDEVQNMLESFGADIKKALLAKRRRFEMSISASAKSSNQKIEQVWKTQQEQWQKLTRDYSQQFLALFQQCHMDIKRVEEQDVKLILMFRQQQRMLQQSRILLSQTLKAVITLYEQFMKNIKDMEKNHENLLTQAQSELSKDLALMLNKILVESQQQEMAVFRKSLQSLIFC